MMLAMLSGMRVTPFLLVPEVTPRGSTGRAKPSDLDPSTRGTVAQLLREVLVLVEEATGAAVRPTTRPPRELTADPDCTSPRRFG